MPNIAIVWDFDGTLSPDDSTTKVVEILDPKNGGAVFWQYVKSLRGDQQRPKWEHVLASDAPIRMYALSRIAFREQVPLNRELFQFVKPHIALYDKVPAFLRKLKLFEEMTFFKDVNLKIHFFIVTAGLKELVEIILPEGLIAWTFGCTYKVTVSEPEHIPESVPVFCMDETMKTRSLFEISKGSFQDENKSVNVRVSPEHLWAPFENIIYIGDGYSDVPALSLVRSKGGIGVAVHDPKMPKNEVDAKHKKLRLDRRADLVTEASFEPTGTLFKFLSAQCERICHRYHAEMAA
ncbi:MAG: haloacid dehalogenase-like hydrolase [Alphaproteobacteria bacterium]|nr:haloacid dehalogenase-like hydrolase [Alphaproteobacteria bacterium]MDE2110959.1 haloacid dehalogenase-like hydrolase [Alphaproteobacteria bacterium]MDE2493644.1 haloacid dehalogenase-like hydrolase [Alphaproteobacteria bacterium]